MVDWQEMLEWGEPQLKDLRALGYDYLRQGQYERAVALFEGLVAMRDALDYDHQTLGGLYLQLGRHEEAIDQLGRALERNSDHLVTRLNRAKALCLSGRWEEGVNAARQLALHEEVAGPAAALIMAYT